MNSRSKIKLIIKSLLLLAFWSLNTVKISAQKSTDVYLEVMSECFEANEFKLITQLYVELDGRVKKEVQDEKNIYYSFAQKFCQDQLKEEFFLVEKGTRLDSLLKKAFHKGMWHLDTDWDKPIMIDGAAIEITPPRNSNPLPKESIEYVYLDPNSKFIKCSKIFTLNRIISTYYSRFDHLGIANSKVKLCSFSELLAEEDFHLNSVKYFITIDVLIQKLLHVNKYDKFISKSKE